MVRWNIPRLKLKEIKSHLSTHGCHFFIWFIATEIYMRTKYDKYPRREFKVDSPRTSTKDLIYNWTNQLSNDTVWSILDMVICKVIQGMKAIHHVTSKNCHLSAAKAQRSSPELCGQCSWKISGIWELVVSIWYVWEQFHKHMWMCFARTLQNGNSSYEFLTMLHN